jgi:hypothetical protein
MPVKEDMLSALCGDEVAHVVLLLPVGESAPTEVEHALAGRANACVRVSDPLAAFTEIALQDRLESTRSAWGLSAAGMTCLVVVDPDAARGLVDMERAIAKYLSHVAIVSFDPAQTDGWRLVRRSERADDSPHPFRRVEPTRRDAMWTETRERTPAAPPALRLVSAADAPRLSPAPQEEQAEAVSAHDDEDETAPSVTRDEIAMLLGGDSSEQDNGAGGAGRGAAR